jgi:multidrug efflux pump subunit AcrA (membrane-fusion protein)
MPRTFIFAALASAACLCSHAGELIIEPGPFTVTQSLAGTVLPEKDTVAIPHSPEKWSEWIIRSITPHGARVAKGDVLVEFDRETLEQKIEDTNRAITAKSLALAQAEQELAQLKSTSEHKLEALRTAARIAKEELEYFTKIRRNAEEKSADQSLERAKQFLANQQEELRQLKKMYEADDLTEETEEIILTRQQNAVQAASFALEMETLRHKRTREVLLPREAVTLDNQNRDTSLALDEGVKSTPRLIEQKSLERDGLKTDLQREKDNLAAWKKDLTPMKITAPDEGWFFHGLIENGRWTTGETTKSLAPGGRPPATRPFATFIPAKTPLALYALTDDATARALTPGQSGKLVFPGREDLDIAASVAAISPTPSIDGKHTVLLRADWPKDFSPAIGTTANIRLVSYHKDTAVSIPLKALHFGNGGFSVSVKLTDGKTEPRPVRRGRVSGENVEILEGLEKGQVVVTPAS